MRFRELKEQDYKNYKKLIDSDINIDYFKHFIKNVLNKNHKIYVLELNNNIIGTGTILI